MKQRTRLQRVRGARLWFIAATADLVVLLVSRCSGTLFAVQVDERIPYASVHIRGNPSNIMINTAAGRTTCSLGSIAVRILLPLLLKVFEIVVNWNINKKERWDC